MINISDLAHHILSEYGNYCGLYQNRHSDCYNYVSRTRNWEVMLTQASHLPYMCHFEV